jgi:hypothetical protein
MPRFEKAAPIGPQRVSPRLEGVEGFEIGRERSAMFWHVLSRPPAAGFGITGVRALLSQCYPERFG